MNINRQEHGLYYDGDRGCYYSYNQAEDKFEFHSQVYAQETSSTLTELVINASNIR